MAVRTESFGQTNRSAWRLRVVGMVVSWRRLGAPVLVTAARFCRNRRGAAAIEFALVAGPFILILFSIIELALVFVINTGLDLATSTLAKQIRTGQVQAPGLTATNLSGAQIDRATAVNQLCNQIAIVSSASCLAQLQIDVRPLPSFQQAALPSPVSGGTFNPSSLCYYSGNAGDIVEMRGFYLYEFVNPMLSMLSNVSAYDLGSGASAGKYRLIQTAQVFKTENFSGNGNSGAGC